uniref:Ig-like domain-containing protein n=1 Tax=Zonotrichia albicollis TaxID=44394 RepID=A0A8D2MXH9_ZONAL
MFPADEIVPISKKWEKKGRNPQNLHCLMGSAWTEGCRAWFPHPGGRLGVLCGCWVGSEGPRSMGLPPPCSPDGSLQISGLLPDDTGMFQCWAQHREGIQGGCAPLCPAGIAPNITRGPQDSTVIDGMAVILNCETSGAPRPAITWQKGTGLGRGLEPVLAALVAVSGSLLVSPAHLSDAGTYTCLATNSRGVDESHSCPFSPPQHLPFVLPCSHLPCPAPVPTQPVGWAMQG